MSSNSSELKINVSHEYEIVPQKNEKAYSVSIKEWEFLKTGISKIRVEINEFYSLGYLFIGGAISALITILATNFEEIGYKYIVITLFAISLFSGLLSLWFGKKTHKNQNTKPHDIISHMNLIDSRFKSMDD